MIRSRSGKTDGDAGRLELTYGHGLQVDGRRSIFCTAPWCSLLLPLAPLLLPRAPLLLPLKRPCSLSRPGTAISNPKFGVYIVYIYLCRIQARGAIPLKVYLKESHRSNDVGAAGIPGIPGRYLTWDMTLSSTKSNQLPSLGRKIPELLGHICDTEALRVSAFIATDKHHDHVCFLPG